MMVYFVLIILGAFMVFKPQWLWKLEKVALLRVGEAPKTYLKLMRLGGVFFVLFGLVKLILSVIM